MALTPKIPITLDRPRHMRFAMTAMAAFDQHTGIDFLHGGFDISALRMSELQALFWACLLEDDPAITMAEVGVMVDVSNLTEVTQVALRCLGLAQPEPTEPTGDPDPNPPNLSA